MGNTLELADISVTDSDGSVSTLPAMTDFVCTPCSGVTPSGIAYAYPQLTGQTISYATYDDAWQLVNNPYPANPANPLYTAKLSNFTTLSTLNEFGNYLRFTDENGDADYSLLIKDHYTGLMWCRQWASSVSFQDAIDTATNATYGGFTDWKLPNINEQLSILDYGLLKSLDYGVFAQFANNVVLRTSTTDFVNTTLNKGVIQSSSVETFYTDSRDKTLANGFYNSMICRAF
jgi:hypothetical protein